MMRIISQMRSFWASKAKEMSDSSRVSTLQRFLCIWFLLVILFSGSTYSKCEFKAIFNFGDSNSDTGGFWAAFPAQSGPFGMTFFKKPVGRATDGRLIIDFLAEGIGVPYISPYLKSIGSNYKNGANFATLASTVLLPNTSLFVSGISPFSLAIQLNQMKEFKARVQTQFLSHQKASRRLPSPDVFGKSLYTLYIGQNDFTSNLYDIGIDGVKKYLPQVVSQIAASIKELHAIGGRSFLVLNMAPVGCYPALLASLPHKSSDIDSFGCLFPLNNAVIYYNNLLNNQLSLTRNSLPNATIVNVDIYSILLHLFQHPTSYGLKYGTRACCGHGGGAYNFDSKLYCGNTKVINGTTVTAKACDDPYNYVSWDGIHTSEAANKIITQAIFNGSYFDPPFPFHQLCDLKPIG